MDNAQKTCREPNESKALEGSKRNQFCLNVTVTVCPSATFIVVQIASWPSMGGVSRVQSQVYLSLRRQIGNGPADSQLQTVSGAMIMQKSPTGGFTKISDAISIEMERGA